MDKDNQIIKVTKIFTLEMAHALLDYDGDCKNIHGHSYLLHVTVSGRPLNEPDHPKDGMVIDFKQLKKIVKDLIIDVHDHALVLNEKASPEVIESLKRINQKLILKSYQPTCENMVLEFVQLIQKALPNQVTLEAIRLYETTRSYATWEK